MNTVRKKKTVDLDEQRYSNLLDDMYFYFYNNYRSVAISEGETPVDLNTFIDALLLDVANFKSEQNKNLKYHMK